MKRHEEGLSEEEQVVGQIILIDSSSLNTPNKLDQSTIKTWFGGQVTE